MGNNWEVSNKTPRGYQEAPPLAMKKFRRMSEKSCIFAPSNNK